ncbi:MAG: HlyD family efflux transporter periplasmic adaptor subunit [Candidatus Omnitrophica bacterium]|nr:HlyD family efflux transporter periplasmic adaptor subunit [Candidatus Omnitrophota bacterium]
MRNKKSKLIFIFLLFMVPLIFFLLKARPQKQNGEEPKEVRPFVGTVQVTISSTGTVLPKNRLEIKPPVNGRVDKILVKEGQQVKSGEVIAWMSSTERAALLDAARGQGDETLQYWQEAYKAIPLISPIDGEVIVATTQPGQTVTATDPVIVLSDHLIVRAQVDETDIGKIKVGQEAVIILDAYSDNRIKATVEHIYYESKTVNNVTIYEVDLGPQEVPAFFRSGMNATIDFIQDSRENALLIPIDAIAWEGENPAVYVKGGTGQTPLRRDIKLGISDGKNVEVISGLAKEDTVVVQNKTLMQQKSKIGTNPFLPTPPRRQGSR